MKKITRKNFDSDPNYPRIVRAVSKILDTRDFVAPVDVFIEMGLLDESILKDWRLGRIPYLERVIQCSPIKAGRILRILNKHAEACGLEASHTSYVKWGRGPRIRLRFTRTGDKNIEEAYSRHFVAVKRLVKKKALMAKPEVESPPEEIVNVVEEV